MIEQVIPANGIAYILPPEEKVLVLFVHGLNGSQNSWNAMVAALGGLPEIQGLYDIRFYNYPTSFIDTIFKPLPSIDSITDGLKSYIDVACRQYEQIILVGHSMGGLICRKYLLDQVKYFKEQSLKIRSLVLYAVPNHGSDLEKVNVLNPWHAQIKELRRNSSLLTSLNRDWDHNGLKSLVTVKYIIAGRDAIVAIDSSRYWSNSLSETDISKTHTSIIKPLASGDISLLTLADQIKNVFDDSLGVPDEGYGVKEEEDDNELEEEQEDMD